MLAALPGVETVEMDRHRQDAFCCGAAGAGVMVTACPLCTVMLEDAVKAENLDDTLQIRELSELVLERLS